MKRSWWFISAVALILVVSSCGRTAIDTGVADGGPQPPDSLSSDGERNPGLDPQEMNPSIQDTASRTMPVKEGWTGSSPKDSSKYNNVHSYDDRPDPKLDSLKRAAERSRLGRLK